MEISEVEKSSKRKRLERKKKKIEAFLRIAKMNDNDRNRELQGAASNIDTAASSTEDASELEKKANDQAQRYKDREKEMQAKLKELRGELYARKKASMERPKLYLTVDGFPVVKTVSSADQAECGTEQPATKDFHQEPQGGETLPVSSRFPQQNIGTLFFLDLQHLLTFALLGVSSSFRPRWCKLLRVAHVEQVVVLELNGVTKQDFVDHPRCFSFITDNFEMCIEMVCPQQYGSTVMDELFSVPLSISQCKKYRVNERSHTRDAAITEIVQEFPKQPSDGQQDGEYNRVDFILSNDQLIQEGYPLPVRKRTTEGYVYSCENYADVSCESKLFAIDCEMVQNFDNQHELAWVAVVNEDLETVYQSLVKPSNRIKSYLTEYSGMTKKKLKNVTTSLAEVQQELQSILPPDAILCGQSLDSDLQALKMYHPYVIDTSVIYNFSGIRNKKPSLKRLAAMILGKNIQDGRIGHNPVEDAIATMELVKLKLKNGPQFGDVIMAGPSLGSFLQGLKEEAETEASPPLDTEQAETKPTGETEHSSNVSTNDKKRKHSPDSHEEPAVKQKCLQSSFSENNQKTTHDTSDSSSGDNSDRCECEKSRDTTSGVDNKEMERRSRFFRREGTRIARNLLNRLANTTKKKAAVVGPEASLENLKKLNNREPETYGATVIAGDTPKACGRSCRQVLDAHDFVYTQLQAKTDESQILSEKTLKKLDKQVRKVAKLCKEKSILAVVFSGSTQAHVDNNGLGFVKIT